MDRIILASGSPRRKQLLEWAEIDFEVMVGHTNEDYPDGLLPEEIPVFIALQKAIAVRHKAGSHIVVAADTVVVLDDQIIGKPADATEAIETLHRLSGRVHQVITGVALLHGDREFTFYETTEVSFLPMTAEGIRHYVGKYKPFDKAGAYAIQEWIGVTGIEWIHGDFYNVMGLPISRLLRELDGFRPHS